MIPPRPARYGVFLPCTFVCVRKDGSIEVKTPYSQIWIVHLLSVSCFDRAENGDKLATRFIKSVLEEADELSVFAPAQQPEQLPFKTSFHIDAHIYVGSEDCLADMIVNAEHGAYT